MVCRARRLAGRASQLPEGYYQPCGAGVQACLGIRVKKGDRETGQRVPASGIATWIGRALTGE